MSRTLFRSAAVALLLAAPLASAADWPRFRGPNGTGATADTAPVKFDPKTDTLWKVPVGSGHSSPIVVGDKIFLQSSAPDASKRTLACLAVASGKELWTADVTGDKPRQLHKKNSPASGTPCSDGERVFAAFWDGQAVTLYAYDLKGKELWNAGLGTYTSQHGAAISPMTHAGKVFVNVDQDGAAELVAFDAKSGEKVWSKPRTPHRACYTTPFLRGEGKNAELIVASTTTVDSYEPDTGKVNWTYTVDWKGQKQKLRAIAQPILTGDHLVLTTGDGSGDRYMVSVKAGGSGDISGTATEWELNKFVPYVPGVLAHKDHIYWTADDGMAACVEVKTGKILWNERAFPKGVSASPILIGDVVLGVGEDGTVVSFKASSKELDVVNKVSLGEPVFATPAVSGGKLYLRGGTNLYCIGKKGS